jgi:hypothetical protein
MAHEGDVDTENRTAAVDEETPLLINDELTSEEQELDPKQLEPTWARWYFWRIFWVIVAAFILAVFIKGWIDAGSDVNASTKTRDLEAFSQPNISFTV